MTIEHLNNKYGCKCTLYRLQTNMILAFVFVLFVNITLAQDYQFTSGSKKAIKSYKLGSSYYSAKNYNEAILHLDKALHHDSEFIEAWLLLGDIYSDLKRFDEAIGAYNSAIALDSTFFPPVYYFLGNIYYEQGDYSNSSKSLRNLLKQESISDDLKALSLVKLVSVDTANYLVNNPVANNPINIGSPLNTTNDEYINFVNTGFDMLMLTKRTKQPRYTGMQYKEELYYSELYDSIWSTPKQVKLGWKDESLNMGTINFSTDGKTMYFTGCYWPDSFGGCDIYSADKEGTHWLEPNNMGSSINTTTWESQPIISSDGKRMYFASKRPGGKGGSDIWMSIKLKNNSWSPPVNMGDSINTEKDEMTPFLHADGNTLFFASNGHPGLGGWDLFVSRADEIGRWSLARNIGYPINTKYNEIVIFSSIDGKFSWISSDRAGGYGKYDIYEFENYDKILPQKVMYVEGLVVNKETKEPINAKVEITNLHTSEIINTTFSDSLNGEFLIVLFPGIDYAFNISKKGFLFLSENINLQDTVVDKSIKQQFELSPLLKGNKQIMNNVSFEFNSHKLLQSSTIELNKLSEMLAINPNINIQIIGHTDSIGNDEYNMKLSKKRAESVQKFLIAKGIQITRLSTLAKGASMPIDSNITEEGRAKNRRTEVLFQ